VKTAFATEERGLGLTVAPVGIAAPVAPLRGVPGVYGDDLAADSLRLVLKEAFELGEAPGVEPAFGFPARGFDTAPDVSEVFHDDSCTRLNTAKHRGRQHVVAIPSEALFTPSEASKVPSGRLSTFGLQSTSEAEYSLDDFFHMPVAVETVVRSDGRPGNPQVDADGLAVGSERNIGQADDDMQVEAPFAINKVSSSRRITYRIFSIFRKAKRYLRSTARSRQADNPLIPIYFEGMQIVPGRTDYRLGTTCFASLLQPGDCRPHGFTGFMYGLNMQVRDESGQSILATAVNKPLECVGIASSLLPTFTTDSIEHLGKLINRLTQCFSLVITWLKPYSYRSIHAGNIPHIVEILQIRDREVCRNSPVA